MRLPPGVFFRPRQRELIAKDAWGIIYIDTKANSNNASYDIQNEFFNEAIAEYLKGDWEKIDASNDLDQMRIVRGNPPWSDVLCSRARHGGDPLADGGRLPDVTVVPNLTTTKAEGLAQPYTILGCTMGHGHLSNPGESRIEEVYEFQSYGLLVLARGRDKIEIWVARDGDKVAVPSGCHRTLYNLGDLDHPLITLHMARQDLGDASREIARTWGPILLIHYDDFEVVFTINELHINNQRNPLGVRVGNGKKAIPLGQRQVRIRRGGRLDLGRLLHQQLTEDPEVIGDFARLGLRIHKANAQVAVEPLSGPGAPRLYFSRPLAEAAVSGTEVYRYFFPNQRHLRNKPRWRRNTLGGENLERSGQSPKPTVKPLGRPLVIVVEGGGDWVEDAYRSLFARKAAGGRALSVFYCDDTRWKEKSPDWVKRIESWEVYLDKADPEDFLRYELLRPDVVFVVTPDFTHAETARYWLGKTPLIFVEKPFDSHTRSVEDLLVALKDHPTTNVFGLDHYQFYALPVLDLERRIEHHLDYALKEVRFVLVERRPIESSRVRTLQHGLTLDLMPHLLALLTYFVDVQTIDQIRVRKVGRYNPLMAVPRGGDQWQSIVTQFLRETASCVSFTVFDKWHNHFPVSCCAVVGKGFSSDIKYLEVVGHNDASIRIDFNKMPEPNPSPGYFWDSLFFLLPEGKNPAADHEVKEVTDPYPPYRKLRVLANSTDPLQLCPRLARLRYDRLLEDLLGGTLSAIKGTLTLAQGLDIVQALDRIWMAVQEEKKESYKLNVQQPFVCGEDDALHGK